MIGYLIVLPSQKNATAKPTTSAIPLFILVLISLGLLIVGILIGAISVMKFG